MRLSGLMVFAVLLSSAALHAQEGVPSLYGADLSPDDTRPAGNKADVSVRGIDVSVRGVDASVQGVNAPVQAGVSTAPNAGATARTKIPAAPARSASTWGTQAPDPMPSSAAAPVPFNARSTWGHQVRAIAGHVGDECAGAPRVAASGPQVSPAARSTYGESLGRCSASGSAAGEFAWAAKPGQSRATNLTQRSSASKSSRENTGGSFLSRNSSDRALRPGPWGQPDGAASGPLDSFSAGRQAGPSGRRVSSPSRGAAAEGGFLSGNAGAGGGWSAGNHGSSYAGSSIFESARSRSVLAAGLPGVRAARSDSRLNLSAGERLSRTARPRRRLAARSGAASRRQRRHTE